MLPHVFNEELDKRDAAQSALRFDFANFYSLILQIPATHKESEVGGRECEPAVHPPRKREIVSCRSCVLARGGWHVNSGGKSPPPGLYLLSLAVGGTQFFERYSQERFPKRVSRNISPREISKRVS